MLWWPRAISPHLWTGQGGFSVAQKLHLSVSCDLETSTPHKEDIWLWHLESKRLHISHLSSPTLLQLGVNNYFLLLGVLPLSPSFHRPLAEMKPKAVTWKSVKSQRVRKHGVCSSLARDLPWLWAGHLILYQYQKWWRPHWNHINL